MVFGLKTFAQKTLENKGRTRDHDVREAYRCGVAKRIHSDLRAKLSAGAVMVRTNEWPFVYTLTADEKQQLLHGVAHR